MHLDAYSSSLHFSFLYCYSSFKLGFSLSCSSDLASSEENVLLWQGASFSLQNNYLFSESSSTKLLNLIFILQWISYGPYWIQIWITGHIHLMEILLWKCLNTVGIKISGFDCSSIPEHIFIYPKTNFFIFVWSFQNIFSFLSYHL